MKATWVHRLASTRQRLALSSAKKVKSCFIVLHLWWLLLLLGCLLIAAASASSGSQDYKRLDIPGDIRLGSIFPIHKGGDEEDPERGPKKSRKGTTSSTPSSARDAVACGRMQREDGIQPLEAMLFTLDEINRDQDLLPGITLGVTAVDSCDNPIHAAEQAVSILKGFITRKVGLACDNSNNSLPGKRPLEADAWACNDNIVGLIGPQTSAVSIQLANLGRLFRVPQVSYLSTSIRLCHQKNFPYFFRTVPSDFYQANAIVEILKTFGWNYVAIVHSDSDYGEAGFRSIRDTILEQSGSICLAEPLTIHNAHFKQEDYVNIVLGLIGRYPHGKNGGDAGEPHVPGATSSTAAGSSAPSAPDPDISSSSSDTNSVGKEEQLKPRVVIVFADRQPAGKLIEAAKTLGVKDKFVWIGSDAWASRESVVAMREEFVEGAIAVQPLRRELPGFNEYFRGLLTRPNLRNPWFSEFLMENHNCTNEDDGGGQTHGQADPEDPDRHQNRSNCGKEDRDSKFKYSQQLYLHFVRDAVYAFAHALHNLHEDSCPDFGHGSGRLCPEFRRRVFVDLPDYLRKVEFLDVNGKVFRFRGEGTHDGPPRYSIVNFRKQVSKAPPAGDDQHHQYDWHNVGTYHDGAISGMDPEFKKMFSQREGHQECQRKRCLPAEVKVPDTNDQCCWHCVRCEVHEYKASEFECKLCPPGQWSGGGGEGLTCADLPETHLEYGNPWAIGSMCMASVGILMTFTAFMVFVRNWDTPVVKACGRELCMILLAGTTLSFLTTFLIVSKPSRVTCGVMRFAVGVCYTICYAAVVTKTNRVARIFGRAGALNSSSSASTGTPAWVLKYTSPLSSALIVLFLTLVEGIINLVWLVSEPPDLAHIVDSQRHKRVLVCKGLDTTITVGLVYPFVLILAATLYAFRTRKCPGGFNETKFIFFANTVTTIHWFVYVPLYLASTDHEIRPVILACSLSVSGIVQLGCLIYPKLYIVVFRPQRNTRNAVMTSHHTKRVNGDGGMEAATLRNSMPAAIGAAALDGVADASSTPRWGGQQGTVAEDERFLPVPLGNGELLARGGGEGGLLCLKDRPRSRSLSITRSTQTTSCDPENGGLIELKRMVTVEKDSAEVNAQISAESGSSKEVKELNNK